MVNINEKMNEQSQEHYMSQIKEYLRAGYILGYGPRSIISPSNRLFSQGDLSNEVFYKGYSIRENSNPSNLAKIEKIVDGVDLFFEEVKGAIQIFKLCKHLNRQSFLDLCEEKYKPCKVNKQNS